MRVLAVGGTVVAAAVGVGVTIALYVAPSAPSPLSAVTSALARTSARSYTFSLATTVRLPAKQLNSTLVSGGYDPRRRLGTERLRIQVAGQAKQAQVRFIGAYVYTSVSPASGFAKLWDKSPLAVATAAGRPPGDLFGFVSDQAVSPSELSMVLRSAGAAVHDSGPVSGPGWTGVRYTFTASISGGREPVRGTVDLDRQGRVRLITTTTGRGQMAPGKTSITTATDIRFADFGAPVPVATPPASEVKSTNGAPYWGFYF